MPDVVKPIPNRPHRHSKPFRTSVLCTYIPKQINEGTCSLHTFTAPIRHPTPYFFKLRAPLNSSFTGPTQLKLFKTLMLQSSGPSQLKLFKTLMLQSSASPPLEIGYYGRTCPLAETIVKIAVSKAVSRNPGIAAGLIRMHFHDCFVRGCDASVLLDPVSGKPAPEKTHPANNPSLRGFEVINEAKALLEVLCPKTVSCSDILAFAARDSALKAGGINYAVPAGRRDGRVSLSSEVAQNLPPPIFNANQLQQNFALKGLSLDEMVTLSGAHSIGVSRCSSFSNRLYSFNNTHPQDPSMDPKYAAYLKNKCPNPNSGNSGPDPTVNLDILTPNYLDNKYYTGLTYRNGLLTSDQTLFSSPLTAKMVVDNAQYGSAWAAKFAAAMVHMGSIEVLTGINGEIRKDCRFVK